MFVRLLCLCIDIYYDYACAWQVLEHGSVYVMDCGFEFIYFGKDVYWTWCDWRDLILPMDLNNLGFLLYLKSVDLGFLI